MTFTHSLIQYNDSQFVKVIHLQLFKNIGSISCVVKYILITYFIQNSLYLLIALASVTPSLLLEETQAGIKIARRNINNLRYAGDTTLTAESEEELKSLLMKVKEESEKLA